MATNCILAAGEQLSCRNQTGGVEIAYISTSSASTTSYAVDANDIITAITNYNPYFKFDQVTETSGLDGTATFDKNNGTQLYESKLALTFHKFDYDKRDLLYVLGQTELDVIVKDNNGRYFLLKRANLSDATYGTGKMFNDMNGVNLTITCRAGKAPQEVNSAVLTTIAPTY